MAKRSEWREESRPMAILPATDWYAVFAVRGDDRSFALESELLGCWALVRLSMRHVLTGTIERGSGLDAVVGIGQSDAGTDYVEDVSGFLGYRHISQPLEDWQWALDKYAAKHQEPNT